MIDNEYIQKAEEELEVLNADEEAREFARLREKAIRDENAALAGAREEGIKEGKKEGIKEGKKEGIIESKKQIAKKMLEKNIDIQTVIELTELTQAEIKELENK